MKRYTLPFAMAFALACGPVTAAPGTLTGPIFSPVTGHWYYLLDSSNWSDAEAAAVALGGHLVTVNDAAEQNWVYGTFSQFGGTNRHLWTGFYDTDPLVNSADRGTRRTEFAWISGQPVSYTNWGAIEPNNPFSGEDDVPPLWEFFVHVWDPTDPYAGYWNNYVDQAELFGHPLNGVVEVDRIQQAPEPSSLALLGLALAGLAAGRPRHR